MSQNQNKTLTRSERSEIRAKISSMGNDLTEEVMSSIRDLATHYDVPKDTIYYYWKRRDEPAVSPQKVANNPEYVKYIRETYVPGSLSGDTTSGAVGRHLGIAPTTVKRIAKIHGMMEGDPRVRFGRPKPMDPELLASLRRMVGYYEGIV